MTSHHVRRMLVAFVAALVALSACAVRPGINPTVESVALTPPQRLSGDGPALVGATPEDPIALEVAVLIDVRGKADLSTLEITGAGVELNRRIVEDWLREAVFTPARRNGIPVPGWFRVELEAKAVGARN